MDEAQLNDLLARMLSKEKALSSSESVRWNAHREAEKLNDASLFPKLIKIIGENQKPNQKNLRECAFFIFGKILKNNFDNEACSFLIQQLKAEKDEDVLTQILRMIGGLKVPSEIDMTNIAECTKSKNIDVRCEAINALGACNCQLSRNTLTDFINLDDEKNYKMEIIYAHASMGKIGGESDIPILEKHLKSRIRDIKGSAEFAIDEIKNRRGKNR